jgi:hypothetical protein
MVVDAAADAVEHTNGAEPQPAPEPAAPPEVEAEAVSPPTTGAD